MRRNGTKRTTYTNVMMAILKGVLHLGVHVFNEHASVAQMFTLFDTKLLLQIQISSPIHMENVKRIS